MERDREGEGGPLANNRISGFQSSNSGITRRPGGPRSSRFQLSAYFCTLFLVSYVPGLKYFNLFHSFGTPPLSKSLCQKEASTAVFDKVTLTKSFVATRLLAYPRSPDEMQTEMQGGATHPLVLLGRKNRYLSLFVLLQFRLNSTLPRPTNP